MVIAERTNKFIRYLVLSLDKPAVFEPVAEIVGARMYYAVSRGGVMVAPTLFGALVFTWLDVEVES